MVLTTVFTARGHIWTASFPIWRGEVAFVTIARSGMRGSGWAEIITMLAVSFVDWTP